ncbi:uridine phosphorylase 1 [Plutella xylostella]|uniref:uridine phosphorylase 1 n=1 Tax=Plutella xylostella TaxID=51655 RepID=UPI002032D87F|nr:uridine phosphorylase 1 [Plutella xylostella]
MTCDCDYIVKDFSGKFEEHYDNCSTKGCVKTAADGTLLLRNPHLSLLQTDVLYHLGFDSSQDLPGMFGDVKFVCMGGTKQRMRDFAEHMRQVLQTGPDQLVNLTKKSHRYAMYKVGPVLAVSHGIGIPSMSILLQEVLKLLHYARAPRPLVVRIGTSGGLGLPPGAVVVSSWAANASGERVYELPILGVVRKFPSQFDTRVSQELVSMAREEDPFPTTLGGTMAADDFYRGQARLDGPFCDHSEQDKMAYLQLLRHQGVRNIEMEATAFAALTREAGVRAADVCVTFLDRLLGDQVTASKETLTAWQKRPMIIVGRYISQYCKQNQ